MNSIEFKASIQNGVIQIPKEYQQDLQDADAIEVVIQKIVKKKKISSTGIISRLIQKPILIANFNPLTREEAHERSL
jgi:phage pi2 protein 07